MKNANHRHGKCSLIIEHFSNTEKSKFFWLLNYIKAGDNREI